jgi:hypothetical protein
MKMISKKSKKIEILQKINMIMIEKMKKNKL